MLIQLHIKIFGYTITMRVDAGMEWGGRQRGGWEFKRLGEKEGGGERGGWEEDGKEERTVGMGN